MEQLIKRIGQLGGFATTSLVAIGAAFLDALEKADKAGYARGYREGEQAAREELAAIKTKLAGILGETADVKRLEQTVGVTLKIHDTVEATIIRAPRGSVAPAVLGALRTSQRGMTPREVANVANIPENSARGSLNKLKHDRAVKKDGQRWFIADREGPRATTQGPSN